MFLEREVSQRYWNQNSKYALAFGKVKFDFSFIIPVIFFKRDKMPEREMSGVSFKC